MDARARLLTGVIGQLQSVAELVFEDLAAILAEGIGELMTIARSLRYTQCPNDLVPGHAGPTRSPDRLADRLLHRDGCPARNAQVLLGVGVPVAPQPHARSGRVTDNFQPRSPGKHASSLLGHPSPRYRLPERTADVMPVSSDADCRSVPTPNVP